MSIGDRELEQCKGCDQFRYLVDGTRCIPCNTLHEESYRRAAQSEGTKKRKLALELLGGRCVCCREERWQFLEFDHRYGDGKEHRREINSPVDWILGNTAEALEKLEILCGNCHHAKSKYGICPHKKEEKARDRLRFDAEERARNGWRGRHTFMEDPVKICPECGRQEVGMENIFKVFNRHHSRPDGLQPYCKGCQKDQRKRRRFV